MGTHPVAPLEESRTDRKQHPGPAAWGSHPCVFTPILHRCTGFPTWPHHHAPPGQVCCERLPKLPAPPLCHLLLHFQQLPTFGCASVSPPGPWDGDSAPTEGCRQCLPRDLQLAAMPAGIPLGSWQGPSAVLEKPLQTSPPPPAAPARPGPDTPSPLAPRLAHSPAGGAAQGRRRGYSQRRKGAGRDGGAGRAPSWHIL